ncbi:hypothetical protein EYC98_14110 [Halieaceae bacterium IMCC14734]|uniref:DUF1214 domain-containing protein n=1 Tax=Candidatus Litorirhabdus singularis TaxID=2518993 RepID=A0ABT3TI70_9GAMM|nr:hypothetical protein [Candidatus Litorirhabdus singularis]MCX2981993.1 hypothetical protein [Candidatus Litorirhabdus singularis]
MTVQNNPIDTRQQRDHERYALQLYRGQQLQQVRSEVREQWLAAVNPGAAMQSCFEAAFDEVMFGAVIWALNQDPLYPKVITISRIPHRLGNLDIPGSRWGIDNPDSVYRVIPVSGDERYLISGKVAEQRLVENYFTLWDPDMRTVGLLSGKDLVVDADGSFTISVDSEPAGDRVNHIQSCATAKEFYIRDVLADWSGDRVNELSVKRLGEVPSRGPRLAEEDLALAAEYMRKWATNTVRWNNQALDKPANDFIFTIDRDTDGALRNQIYIMGHFHLPDPGQVLVLDVNMGGAEYFIAPITNYWGTTNNIVERNGCLNMMQSRANADGTYTFVLSTVDPGVHNWLDPDDMDTGILTLRWAEFEADQANDELGVTSRLMPLDEFLATAPADQRVSPAQRLALSQQRSDSYQWRLTEEKR